MVAAQPPPPSSRRADARAARAPSSIAGRVDEARRAIPPSFAGMSIEYWAVPDYIGSGGKVNPIFARLVQTLAAGGQRRADAALRRQLDRRDVVEPGRGAAPR